MKLKSLLSISTILLVLLSCSEERKIANSNTTVEFKDSIDLVVEQDSLEEQNSLFVPPKEADDTLPKKNSNIEKGLPSYQYTYKGVTYEGWPPTDSTYIMWPEAREKDSIRFFTETYPFLSKKLERKGMSDWYSRDSFLWDFWQKKVCELDLRHTYVPYDRSVVKRSKEVE